MRFFCCCRCKKTDTVAPQKVALLPNGIDVLVQKDLPATGDPKAVKASKGGTFDKPTAARGRHSSVPDSPESDASMLGTPEKESGRGTAISHSTDNSMIRTPERRGGDASSVSSRSTAPSMLGTPTSPYETPTKDTSLERSSLEIGTPGIEHTSAVAARRL